MGMYDSFYLPITCPFCGYVSEMDVQTKELDCSLKTFHIGDHVSDKYNYLDCIADCLSPECVEYTDQQRGYHSGFGRLFYVRVYIEDGKLNGKYKILKDED